MSAPSETRSAWSILPLDPDDAPTIDEVLALNEHWVPHVGSIGRDALRALVEAADLAVVAVPSGSGDGGDPEGGDLEGGAVDGFLILIAPGADYASPNYRYFQDRLDTGAAPGPFRYVDRIAVSPRAQGRGLGRVLYDAAVERAVAVGAAEVTCEVNLEPPNPDSLAFHDRLGFVPVGTQWTYDGTVRVQLMARPV